MRPFRPLLTGALVLALPLLAQAPAAPPPEAREVQAALALQDPAARAKELERILAAHPQSALKPAIEFQLRLTRVALAANLDEVLALQAKGLEGATGSGLVGGLGMSARQILDHAKVATFDKARVLAAVQDYRDRCRKAVADPAVVAATDERTREYLPLMAGDLEVLLARAQALAGAPAQALATLEAHGKSGIPLGPPYHLARADALEALGRSKEALEPLIGAALENSRDGQRRAKEAFLKQGGKEEAFEALLDARRRELPFHPAPVKPGAAWKGRAVLLELFTGSECPPCVAADLAVDGLLESHPAPALVVLEYHLPIPGPDPMMNPASKKRQEYYAVNSTPTSFVDGLDRQTGGGGRSMAAGKYRQLAAQVAARQDLAPGLALKLAAARKGDAVEATLDLGRVPEGVDCHLALVQSEQEHKGGNKVLAHKMVVRDLQTLAPGAAKAAFDLAASEKATDAYLTDFEATSTRFKGFKFPLRRAVIAREGLKLVLFAQERASRQVLQAVVAEVK